MKLGEQAAEKRREKVVSTELRKKGMTGGRLTGKRETIQRKGN